MNNLFQLLWDETGEALYYISLWLLNNNYSLQMYYHAAKIAFM